MILQLSMYCFSFYKALAKGKHLKLDNAKVGAYFDHFAKSGFISKAYIDSEKAYLKKCESVLFDNTIQTTTNFCVTQKGILFLYNPYEIAAYAYGEIELFIPFEEVKNVLNPLFVTFFKK